MKKLILLELCLIFMATAFKSDSPPPGWYIQPIPVNKNIVDIYFTDTLNGWAVTEWAPAYDTGYILKTTNGGMNWSINFSPHASFHSIQFLDLNTGYACAGYGTGVLYKTTNGGVNWNIILNNGFLYSEIFFINKDTGWICDNGPTPFGVGLLKTTNGGINWFPQLDNSYQPQKLFFLNKDSGWMMSAGGGIYRTNNSGNNWTAIYNFGSTSTLYDMFFTSSDTGWITQLGQNNSIMKTINGGHNWQAQIDPLPSGSVAYGIYMINSNKGYIATLLNKILKTYNGVDWGRQEAPNGAYEIIYFVDSLNGRAAHSYTENNIAATFDGGGPIMGINQIGTEIPIDYILEQNYPNPFNAISKIKYQIPSNVKGKTSNVKLLVYNITGKEVAILVNEQLQPGIYEVTFDGNNLSSGIYFYSMFANGVKIDTKKLVYLK